MVIPWFVTIIAAVVLLVVLYRLCFPVVVANIRDQAQWQRRQGKPVMPGWFALVLLAITPISALLFIVRNQLFLPEDEPEPELTPPTPLRPRSAP